MTKPVTGDPLLDDQLPPSAPGVGGNSGGPYGGAGGGSGAVDSVNTKTGAVTLVASDVSAQPVDSDLTAIAALSTTTFGRALLSAVDAAGLRTTAGLGTVATHAATEFDASGAAVAAQAADQPVDSDLTAIAALTTTTYGRALLALADAAATKTALSLVKADVGLGSVDNTADTAKVVAGDVTGTLGASVLAGTAGVESIIRANTLDQLGAPAANLSMATHRITNVSPGVSSTDAATLGQVTNGTYGDGSDGSPTFDGSTTILGMVPSSNVYTLTRDLYLASPTINTGVTLAAAGFRIFVNGTITGVGTAKLLGSSVVAPGGSFSAGTAGQGVTLKTVGGSPNGAGGANTAGANGTATTNSLGGNAGAAGAGALAAGTSGTATAPAATLGSVRSLPWAILGATLSASSTTIIPISGGASGGAGGGNGTTNFGGAGGGGGGVLVVAARIIAGSLTLAADGGAGENARGAGNCGGGGGGGGGVVILVSQSTAVPTTSAAGGAGGAKLGTGTAGSAGSAGTVILVPN